MSSKHTETDTAPTRLSRRGLLTGAAGAAVLGATGVATPAVAAEEGAGHPRNPRHAVPKGRISIQLYTVRDILSQDVEGTLARLAEIGYQRVETAGFAGLTAAEFRQRLDDVGLRATSAHMAIPQPFDADAWQQSLDDATTIGATYVVHPFFGVDEDGVIRDPEVWRAFAGDLNRAGEQAREAGLHFGYHNHHFEFVPLVGTRLRTVPFDILTEDTDPDLVHIELDLYWSFRGATDPVDVIHRNEDRIKQFHVKDMNTDALFADLGTGLIDFQRIFRHAHEAGTEEFIVERDDAGTDPREPADALDTAEVGYEYLASVRF
jgi:sugar phosphate isomerase/epimerase